MKKQIFALTCLALSLTACGGNDLSTTTSQPQSTVITVVETPSASAISSAHADDQTSEQAPQAPAQSTQVAVQQTQTAPTSEAPQPTETPVQAIQMPTPPSADGTVQSFAGTTQKGNDVYFVIFPKADQQSIKNFAGAANLTGSWGSLCSNMATHDQLKETAIETYLSDMSKTWISYDYAFHFSGKTDIQLAATKAKILEVSNQYSAGYASCKPFYSGYDDATSYAYTGAAVGQYNVDLPNSNLAPLNKL